MDSADHIYRTIIVNREAINLGEIKENVEVKGKTVVEQVVC